MYVSDPVLGRGQTSVTHPTLYSMLMLTLQVAAWLGNEEEPATEF